MIEVVNDPVKTSPSTIVRYPLCRILFIVTTEFVLRKMSTMAVNTEWIESQDNNDEPLLLPKMISMIRDGYRVCSKHPRMIISMHG